MEESWVRLAVSWWDKPPLPKALNVYRIVGSVDFEDGKAIFQLERNGKTVKIDVNQLFRISAVDLSKDNGT